MCEVYVERGRKGESQVEGGDNIAMAIHGQSRWGGERQFLLQSTSSVAASHVKTCPSLGRGLAYRPSGRDSSSSLPAWLESCAPPGCSSRTSQDCSHRTKVGTSRPSSKRFPNAGMFSRGESWTAVISESPSGAVESTLSDILEPNVPPRFFLSPRAAKGILRRAAKRGRELPTALREALESVAGPSTLRQGLSGRTTPNPPSGTGMPTLGSVGAATPMSVRRLSPTECERLQAFPTVENSVIIEVCGENPKRHVRAGDPNHRWPSNASPVVEDESMQYVGPAERGSFINHHNPAPPADVVVLIDFVRGVLQINSHGKCLWYATSASEQSSYPLRMPVDDFVRLGALLTTIAARITHNGRGALHPSNVLSPRLVSGNVYVQLFGREITEHADDAGRAIDEARGFIKSITSGVIGSFQSSEQTLKTLSCCVIHAISSFIPDSISSKSSYCVNVTVIRGWTCACDEPKLVVVRQGSPERPRTVGALDRAKQRRGSHGYASDARPYRDVGHWGLEISTPETIISPLQEGRAGGGGTINRPHVLLEGQAESGEGSEHSPQPCKERPCCSDGPRYAALGDAVTVSVAWWIGARMRWVHEQRCDTSD